MDMHIELVWQIRATSTPDGRVQNDHFWQLGQFTRILNYKRQQKAKGSMLTNLHNARHPGQRITTKQSQSKDGFAYGWA